MFYVEEPIVDHTTTTPQLVTHARGRVTVAVPHLPPDSDDVSDAMQAALVSELFARHGIRDYVLWYYTPMALAFTSQLAPAAIVYDCMDELSAFKGASPRLTERENALLAKASLVLTGGESLYQAKRRRHHNIHPFPSSVDAAHFAQARAIATDPDDQASLPHPRLGFFGVIDERMDLDLLGGMAAARPDWHFVLLGPVVKIDRATLPTPPNIHYLGQKSYEQLPHYLAGWDVALLPFARNDATRYISPTKTPEYLAAGKPVVSTSIQDVVRPYGEQRLVRIADDVEPFVAACAAAMAEDPVERTRRADAFLRHMSWDATWQRIQVLMDMAIASTDAARPGGALAAAL